MFIELSVLYVKTSFVHVCHYFICVFYFDFGGKKRLGSGGANKKKQQRTVRVNAGA